MLHRLMMVLLLPFMLMASDYHHQIQLNLNLANTYYSLGDSISVAVLGTKNVEVQIYDRQVEQPIWSFSKEMSVDNGSVSISIEDEQLDWLRYIRDTDLYFRVTIDDDYRDFPFEFLPFSLLSDTSNRARFFNDNALIFLDYDHSLITVNDATPNSKLSINGRVSANRLVGDGVELLNLTGPGFNDGYSLNSVDGVHKDVLFIDDIGYVGIHTTTPSAKLHIKGNTVFRGIADQRDDKSYLVPSGSLLLWDPFKSVFRSGIFSAPIPSSFLGQYSVAFGEDVVVKSMYSSVLGGQSHLIDSNSISSVILGGQNHSILDNYSVIAGGYGSLISGEWSVVFGGRDHTIYGDYNVVLGGKSNEIRGLSNMIVGQSNQVRSDHSVVLGNHHRVSSNQVVALGQSTKAGLKSAHSILYSDGTSPVVSAQPKQMILQSRRGLGINMAPLDPHQLSVSGNIMATRFIGDGRHLTNIISGQDYWRQKRLDNGEILGIHYMQGPVSIGLTDSKSTLTVLGGITVQESEQASNGTLGFTTSRGLEFFHDDWISVDQVDTDTLLTPGPAVQLSDDRFFSLHPLEAAPFDLLYFNGEEWAPQDVRIWKSYEDGIFLPKKLGLTDDSIPSIKASLVIKSPTGGTSTPYPLVVGQTDAIRFNPTKNAILFNIEEVDDSQYRMVDSLLSDSKDKSYGGLIEISDGQFNIRQTVMPYYSGQGVELMTLLNLSSESMYLKTETPQATFDSTGSVSFFNTVVDYMGAGIGFRHHLSNRFPNYMAFDSNSDLNFYSGIIGSQGRRTQPINFISGGEPRVVINPASELVVGDGEALGKLSVFGGGLAFNVDDTRIKTSLYYDQFTFLQSISPNDSSIQLYLKIQGKEEPLLMVDFGHLNTAFGTKNSESMSLLAYSEHDPRLDLQSLVRSVVFIQNATSTFSIQNNEGLFSIKNQVGDRLIPVLNLDDSNHLSLLTDVLSERPNEELVVSGDIELSNTDKIQFMTSDQQPIASILKSLNQLNIQHNNAEPIRFQTEDDQDILIVSADRKIAIHSLSVTQNAELYVVNDVLFKSPIYYRHDGVDQLVQSFVIDTTSILEPENNLEVRSIKSLHVDEESGIILDILSEDQIRIQSPGYYIKMFETELWDGEDLDPTQPQDYIEANGKDILELRETYPNGGVSINLYDMTGDGTMDSIKLYNPLIDGGLIEGDLDVYGMLTLFAVNADGSEVTGIPYQWVKDPQDHLFYLKGNVGINTMTPNYQLEVDATMKTEQLTVSDTLYVHQVDFDLTTATTANQHILFSVDENDDDAKDTILFRSPVEPLVGLVGTDEYHYVGLFDDTPSGDLHIKQSGGMASVLFESKASGVTSIEFNNSNTNKGAIVQVNTDGESQFIASRNIHLHAAGTEVAFIKDRYVSIGSDPGDSFKNELFVDYLATVGTSYAGKVIGPDLGGLTVEGRMSVGHLTSVSTGATFFSKDSLRVGDIPMADDFKGVIVKDRVGVGIPAPTEGLAIKSGLKFKDLLTMYDFDDTELFELTSTTFNLLVDDRSLDVQISSQLSFDTKNDQRAMTIFHNSTTIGPETDQDETANLVIYDNSDPSNSTVTLEDTAALPMIKYSVDSGNHQAVIGLISNDNQVDIAIESSGADLSDPDIHIQTGQVGVGLTPSSDRRDDGSIVEDYAMDVDGTVKVENLYKNGDRMYPVPHGAIVMWSGNLLDIPPGWALCDGRTVDTPRGPMTVPNLKDKFIKGVTNANDALKRGLTDADRDLVTGYIAGDIGEIGGANNAITSGADGDHEHLDGGHLHKPSGGNHTHGIVDNNYRSFGRNNGHENGTPSIAKVALTYLSNGTKDRIFLTGTACHKIFGRSDQCANKANPADAQGGDRSPFFWGKRQFGETMIKKPVAHQHGTVGSHKHSTLGNVLSSGDGNDHSLNDDEDAKGPHTHGGGYHNHSWNNQPEYYIFAFIIKVSDI